MQLTELLLMLKPGSGCDYHRLVLPLGYAGYDFAQVANLTPEKVRSFKGIAYNRIPLTVKTETLVKLREQYGHKLWMDVDDHWELSHNHYLKASWTKGGVTERIKGLLKIADVVTCTTERLAGKVREFNSNAIVIPNALPFIDHSQFSFKRFDKDFVRFGFVGGASHLHDVRQLIPVFQQYSQMHFKFCGYSEKNDQTIKMAKVFSNDGKNKNYRQIGMQPLDSYLFGYNDLDVCIAPLEDVEFNKYKSNLKVIEAGLKKCAVICSPNPCYTDTVPEDVVTYAKSVKDWKAAFKQHMDIGYARERGEKLYAWVKENYDLVKVNEQRLKLLESL